MRSNHAIALGFPILLAACGPSATSSVESGSMSGYYAVDFALKGLEPDLVESATLGGVNSFGLIADGETLTMTVQGAPTAGPADLVLTLSDGERVTIDEAFVYDPPADPMFSTVVAFGASLTQGVQSGVPTYHGATMSPSTQAVRQMGAYHPLPALQPGLFPTLGPLDIGPAPQCEIPDVLAHVTSAAGEVLVSLIDPDTNEFALERARVDPDADIHNVAVGGANMFEVITGPGDSFSAGFIHKLVLDPYGDVLVAPQTFQIEFIEAAEPTILMSTDLFGNDLIGAIVTSEVIDSSQIADADTFRLDLIELLDRLVATDAHIFIANTPRPTLLPATWSKRQRMIDDGVSTEADVDADIARIEELAVEYNAVLDEEAALRPTVHVVDVAGQVQTQEDAGGIEVDGEFLRIGNFGGLLSLDGVHFSDTGYALMANEFIAAINSELGTAVEPIDLSAIKAQDENHPDVLRAAGFEPDLCVASEGSL